MREPFIGGYNAYFWVAAAASMVICGGAWADEELGNGDAAIGIGIMCNTSQQAEQFVKLQSTGTQAEEAARAVNASARDSRACGVAAIAYIRAQTVYKMKLRDKLVQIVRINVVEAARQTGADRAHQRGCRIQWRWLAAHFRHGSVRSAGRRRRVDLIGDAFPETQPPT
jgi:hypothetical protein